MKEYTFLAFIRDIGKHITVNYMMSKDSVKKRISGDDREGMSFTEFTYQLVQGYDFLYLFENHNCKLQMGGSDQWGNITTGTELIRRKANGEAFALTCPLITKADGGKFGKTEQGNIWLDSKYTTPYTFYQFWLNVSDEDAEKYIKIFTMLSRETIESSISEHKEAPHMRTLQKLLAKEVTIMVHGESEYDKAVKSADSIQDVYKIVEKLWAKFGDTLPSNFMILDFGRKRHLWVTLKSRALYEISDIFREVMAAGYTIDSYLVTLLKEIDPMNFIDDFKHKMTKIPEGDTTKLDDLVEESTEESNE
jgi:tyrosyl-tRNA synthetase